MDLLRPTGDPHMAINGTALLREAGHVENRAALSFEMRRHSEQRTDRNHTGSTDAGDEDAVGLTESRMKRLGQRRQLLFRQIASVPQLQRTATYCNKTRTETFEAGKILVAARLIYRPF